MKQRLLWPPTKTKKDNFFDLFKKLKANLIMKNIYNTP